jgi:hypothetical protein
MASKSLGAAKGGFPQLVFGEGSVNGRTRWLEGRTCLGLTRMTDHFPISRGAVKSW